MEDILNNTVTHKKQKNLKDVAHADVGRNTFCRIRAETRRQSVSLFGPSWKLRHQAAQKNVFVRHVPASDCRSTVNIDFGLQIIFSDEANMHVCIHE